MNYLQPITTSQFNDLVKSKFNNIIDGFNNYKNFEINGNNSNTPENSIICFLSKIFETNNNEMYIDLFFNQLSETEKNNVINLCPVEYKKTIINIININHNEPYYKVCDKKIIPLLVSLNTHEIFFTTFFCVKIPITIWGNYNMNFPCFFNNIDSLNFYKKIASNYNLIEAVTLNN